MNTYLDDEFLLNLQKSIKIEEVGAQFGVQLITQSSPTNMAHLLNINKHFWI
jgi:hypothetical protein